MDTSLYFTSVPIPKFSEDLQIDYHSKIVSIGSCFANNISEKFNFFKFSISENPFGIIFHPLAIETIFERSINKRFFTEKDLFFHNNLWHSFEVHSQCSKLTFNELKKFLNNHLVSFNQKIKNATHIFITLGTAWVYKHLATEKIVSNCHKVSQKNFEKVLLNFSEILESLKNIETLIRKENSQVKIIFTISPVRHIKDGLIENNISKSLLITALHSFLNERKSLNFYFPSYEILLDELRDYRFYADDLLHPSPKAITHIWEKFKDAFVKKSCFETMKTVQEIQQNLQHKPFQPQSENHKKFIAQTSKKIIELQKQFPEIYF